VRRQRREVRAAPEYGRWHGGEFCEGGELLLVIPAIAVLRVFAITGMDRVIPNFTSLDQALTQTSAGGPGGHRRADGAPEGSEQNGLLAQHGTSEPDAEAC
jgi:hypothetical protein